MIIRNILLGIAGFVFLEIYVGINAIHEFGFANVFFACVAAFVLGVGIFRTSSLRLTVGVAQAMNQGKPPGLAALDGALIGLAGVLFIIPGFLSDVVAVLLLIPPFRRWCARRLVNAISFRQTGSGASAATGAWAGVDNASAGGRAGPRDSRRSSSASERYDASSAIIDVDAVVVEDKHLPKKN